MCDLRCFGFTIVKIDEAVNGHLRPNFLIKNPKTTFPGKAPIANADAIQDASSIVIFPDGSGDLSDVSKSIEGDDQPQVIP